MKTEINAEGQLVLVVDVTDQFLMDVLCTAVETPPSNWFNFSDAERDKDREYLSVVVADWGDEDQAQSTKKITLEDLRRALPALIAGTMKDGVEHANLHESYRMQILKAIMDDDAGMVDANHADSILQAAYFGHIVYG